jgi:NAD(P)-dependent dehydrogenase (short-subunit alcohol dehydrogenase family)
MASENQDVYVVTGGAGGMGFASAQRLGKLGRVLLTDVVSGPLEKAAAQLSSEGIRVSAHVTDISSKASVYALAGTASSLGRLAGIAHTAGVSPVMADWKRLLNQNRKLHGSSVKISYVREYPK